MILYPDIHTLNNANGVFQAGKTDVKLCTQRQISTLFRSVIILYY